MPGDAVEAYGLFRGGLVPTTTWRGCECVEKMSRVELATRFLGWTGLSGPMWRRSLADTVRALGAVQIDPMQVVAPAHLWTLSLRRGPTPLIAMDRALRQGQVLEGHCHARCLVAWEDHAALVAGFRRRRNLNYAKDYGVQEEAARLLAFLERTQSLSSRQVASATRVAGYWDAKDARATKASSVALEILWAEGRIAVLGRAGGEKVYTLMESHLPVLDHLTRHMSQEEAFLAALSHSVRSMGVLPPGWPNMAWGASAPSGKTDWRAKYQLAEAQALLQPVEVEGDRWWVVPELLQLQAPARHRSAQLLSPLDNVLWHRPRLMSLFDFDYRWEAYTPTDKRKIGPYNMPVLWCGQFWGQADARWQDGALQTRLVPDRSVRTVPSSVAAGVGRADRLARALRENGQQHRDR